MSLGFAAAQAAPAGVLTIRFLDVGQGDAVLITSPEGKSVLVDGGRSESRMRELIRQYDIKNVSLVVATHADSDHITGLVPIVALNRPQYFVNNGLAGTTQIWQKLTNVVQQAGTKGLKAADQVINLGSVKLTVLPPPPGMKDQNTNSVGLLVQYGTFRALVTGDSESPETMAWLQKYPSSTFGPVDVYKSIHHGAVNGDTITWLRAVQPKNVVISVGPNNYGHPTRQALDLYRSVKATTYRTDQQGTVTVTVQPGGRYAITTEKGAAVPVRPTPAPAVPVTPAPGGTIKSPVPLTPPPARDLYYPNCAAVRAAGAAPLLRGQPGYRAGLDRDGDGRACE
ncbi:excalibur calcium-binding domain-containing protein [Deinococcus cavernae]|uniref:excalibur calcium-binding domain-containing protein n=1 Tax=Deinococcus cavernae TaxID=2320857 RepID=UPI001F39FCF6|nr:excalibur calcium-binding domain-containing protein [Deinococcus cavernae]